MSRSRRLLLAITFICLLLGWLELYHQPAPQTAGVVLRQIEEVTRLAVTETVESITGVTLPKSNKHDASGKNIQQIIQEELAERKAIEEAQAEGKLVVTLGQINFQGVSILGDMELKEAVAKYLNVPMNYEQMLEIGMTVESYYRQHNYLARVILPPQDLSSGVLQLDVIESVVSKVEVEQKLEEMPNAQAHVLALIASQQAQGEYLNAKSIERGLALANEVPAGAVQASLKEGEKAGDTDLLLRMYQARAMDSDVAIDNAGSRSTGAERLTKTEGNFNKVRSVVTWQQPITPQTSTYVSYTAHLAIKNLDLSEKMQLGGMNGVLAYPTGETGKYQDGSYDIVNQIILRVNPVWIDDSFFQSRGNQKDTSRVTGKKTWLSNLDKFRQST